MRALGRCARRGGARTKGTPAGLARARVEASRVAVVQYDDRPLESLDAAYGRLFKLNEDYCRHHGYEYIFVSSYVPQGQATSVSAYWAKVFIVRDILREGRYEFAVWLDSDAVVNHMWLSVPAFFRWATRVASCPPKPHAVLAISEDPWIGPHNAGAWIARRTPDAVAFFDEWLSHYDPAAWSKNERGSWVCRDPESKRLCPFAGLAYEQGALHLLDQSRIATVPWTVLANHDYNQLRDNGAFVMHFMGEHRGGMYDYLGVRERGRWPSAAKRIRDYTAELDKLAYSIERAETGRIPGAQRVFLETKEDVRRWVDRLRQRTQQITAAIARIEAQRQPQRQARKGGASFRAVSFAAAPPWAHAGRSAPIG
jgi:hypothetical protein